MDRAKDLRRALDAARHDLVAAPAAPAPASGQPAAGATPTDAMKDTAVRAAGRLNDHWARSAFWTSTLVFAAAGLVGVLVGVQRVHGRWTDGHFALTYASGTTAVLLILVGALFAGWDSGGLTALIVGKDNRISTSKTQVGLWTIALVFAFLYFTFLYSRTGTAAGFDVLQGSYLLLLGGPFAAAVLAGVSTATKVGDGTEQKSPAAAPSAADVVQADDGSLSLSDTQFLLFNLVALAYFAFALAKDPTHLPAIPDTLVGLTSISALSYLGTKVVSSSQPAISSISIVEGAANGAATRGARLRILGANFMPAPAQPETDSALAVTFNGNEVTVLDPAPTDREILVTVPDLGSTQGPIDIAVRTTKGAVTEPYRTILYAPPPA